MEEKFFKLLEFIRDSEDPEHAAYTAISAILDFLSSLDNKV